MDLNLNSVKFYSTYKLRRLKLTMGQWVVLQNVYLPGTLTLTTSSIQSTNVFRINPTRHMSANTPPTTASNVQKVASHVWLLVSNIANLKNGRNVSFQAVYVVNNCILYDKQF